MTSTFAFTTPTLVPTQHRRVKLRPQATVCATIPPTTTSQQPLKKTPAHRRIPVIGFIIDNYLRNVNSLTLRKEFGPIYTSDFLGLPVIVVSDIDAISTIYRDVKTFLSAGSYPPTFSKLFGDKALFGSDGDLHSSRRNAVLPAFSSKLFSTYFEIIREASTAVWTRVSAQTKTSPTQLNTVIRDHYFRVILSITTGDNFSTAPVADREAQIIDLRDNFINISVALLSIPIMPSYHRAIRSRASLLKTLSALVCDRLSKRAGVIDRLRIDGAENFLSSARSGLRKGEIDLLTVLCAMSELQTGEGVVHDAEQLNDLGDLVLLLWFAGFSTQSTATLCAIFEMAKDREIWRRLREEQDALVEAAGGQEISLEQVLREMPLMDSYVNEILRVFPPAAAIFRRVGEDAIVDGHLFKKGKIVALDLWGAQRDEGHYPEPNRIDIGRFLKQKGREVPKAPPPVITFGVPGGAHYCLGAALSKIMIKGTLGTLVREFELELDPDQSMEIQSIPELMPRSGVVAKRCERRECEQ